MRLSFVILLQIFIIALVNVKCAEPCPHVCVCRRAALSDLPINSVLIKTHHHEATEEHVASYEKRNEVLDEADEQVTDSMDEDKLKAATCVLDPTDNLPLFLSLPSDLQVLEILQGPGSANITLDKSSFEHLQQLVVLEIHGFQHGSGIIRLRNDALKSLQFLKYLNLQYVHLLGDRGVGNRPAPVSELNLRENGIQFPFGIEMETNTISEQIQLIPDDQGEADIVPYSVYKDEQERAGLSSFSGLNNLTFLRAFHCNIKEVNWEMFDGLQNLQYLSLEGNKIPFLHEFSFYGTPNLKHLTLSQNNLLNVQSTALAGLLKLEILDLSYNNITYLTEYSLPPFPQLIVADIHHNPLELILPHTFHVMNNTEQLFLGGKAAQLEIRPNSFLGLDKVLKMSLNSVYLTELEREYLTGMPKLKQLKMEGIIHKLSFDAFAEVPKLQELILKHCSIHKISMDAFFGLYGLLYLDLSHNEFESLPPSLFDQQSSLKEIILHHNKLTTLPQGLFIHTQAKLIRLDKNPWHCSCDMSEWQPSQINKIKVKVTDNSLCQTRYDKGITCKVHQKYQYRYDQSVGPRCTTPTRFSGWSVFHMLRKHPKCDNYFHKHKKNTHIEKHLKKGQSQSTKSTDQNTNMSNANIPTNSYSTTEYAKTTNDGPQTTNSTYPSTTFTNEFENATEMDQTQNNELNPINTIELNQNMWTDKDKQKFKLLQEKEERISRKLNSSATKVLDASSPEGAILNENPPIKLYKKSPNKTKWQLKMEDTIRRLNQIPAKK